jgi:hypothetical protein
MSDRIAALTLLLACLAHAPLGAQSVYRVAPCRLVQP